MDEEEPQKRSIIGINAVSIMETDATVPSAEEIAEGDIAFAEIIRSLPSERDKFIAVALYQGWNQREIAFMLCISFTTLSEIIHDIRVKLAIYRVRHR